WVERYGLPPASVIAWSGDNPCSLIGVGLVTPGRIGISLGTSDTLFGLLRAPRIDPAGASHVFGAATGDYMALVCFKNGSLARERVRAAYGLEWHGLSRLLRATPPEAPPRTGPSCRSWRTCTARRCGSSRSPSRRR